MKGKASKLINLRNKAFKSSKICELPVFFDQNRRRQQPHQQTSSPAEPDADELSAPHFVDASDTWRIIQELKIFSLRWFGATYTCKRRDIL